MDQTIKKKWYKKWWVIILFGVVAVVVLSSSGDTKEKYVRESTCKTTQSLITYNVLEEKDRNSDVAGKLIHECYIVINKTAPTLSELTDLASALGREVNNVEFFIFDSNQAYEIDKNRRELSFRENYSESVIPDTDWAVWDVHYLARYLKSNVSLSHNKLTPISDIYPAVDGVRQDIQITN